MSDTKNNVDLNKNDELIKKWSEKNDRKTAHRASRQRAYFT